MRELGNEMQLVEEFKQYLVLEEKSKATIDKYMRDIVEFLDWEWEPRGSGNVTIS